MTTVVCEPKAGETRDCLDPWKMAFIKADGSVSLCCWSAPVGNIKDGPVDRLLANDLSRDMRRGLLTGRIPHDCVRCPARTLVPVATLRAKVQAFIADDGREETLKMRSSLYGLQEELVALRHHVADVETESGSLKLHAEHLESHAKNLEEERGHLRQHNELLLERVQAVEQGRVPLSRLLKLWFRGRARRSVFGRWWIGRKQRTRSG